MKKRMMHRGQSARAEIRPDISGMIAKIQEQLVSLERKIDTLMVRPPQKPAEARPFPRPFQQHNRDQGRDHNRDQGRGLMRQDNSYRDRTLYKAVCADCNKECEVPFKPSGGRPVYCKECFSKRKASSPHQEKFDNRPREAGHPRVSHFDGPQPHAHGGEKKRHAEKKRPAPKRQKRRG